MSFVRTLVTLAAGYAAAKGVEKFQTMGGMTGVQQAMKDNPALAGMQDQMSKMMEQFGMKGAADDATARMQGAQQGAMAGLGGLMSVLGGAAATGTEQAGRMLDAMTGTTAATDAQEENAKLMIRAMIQAAKADGEIDAEERARILEVLGDAGEAETAFVQAELDAPVDPGALAADTGEQMRAQVYAAAVMAVRVDTASEAGYLDSLAAALQLSPETRAAVHRSMGMA